ncbi:c-type cytochrome [Massilia horti]|uniref:C-type cytochrome n=1 Tax=Massilia horti TaxID=2562153 RepID=A0A4Y9T1R2_9BURK|nr:c-type cytochrome [Massilia horti]TFW32927.1 c-type cytochrome [Massilia horti]
MDTYKPLRTAVATVFAVIVLAAIAGAGIDYFGLYNVAATHEHANVLYHFLHGVMRRSVSARADDIQVPDLDNPRQLDNGFVLFREHCLQCHGAPGVAPHAFAFGLRPMPPDLVSPAKDWPSSHLYWVIKYGIKMTAMPAWEHRLSEQDMWALTAFLKRLPTMSPADYRQWNMRLPPAGDASAATAPPPGKLGNARAGRHAVDEYLCATCHQIPGVAGADSTVGPPLAGIGRRKYIGGVLPNTPENMVRWLHDPQQVKPGSAMPNLRIREQDAADIAAFLYTLDQTSPQ